MKISKYNKILNLDGGKKIAFNSISCALTEVNDKFLEILDKIDLINYEKLEESKKVLVDKMLSDNYIIHDYVDEMKLIKYKHFNIKFSRENTSLTIAPTMMCNFQCSYCFETSKDGIMGKNVIQGILNMLPYLVKTTKSIRLVWFGGEPLIAMDVIYKISKKTIQICEKNDVRFSAFMVTNGYLINNKIIEKLKECRITRIQITFDGPPDIHNKRRMLKGNKEGTFNIILNNTKRLVSNDITPNIRINIDKTNRNKIGELLDILCDNELNSFPIDFGQILSLTKACASISETCLNTKEYAAEKLKYQEILYSKNFNIGAFYPKARASYCTANLINSIIIDTKGYMYKCWNDIGNSAKAVGNVVRSEDTIPDVKMYYRNIDYITKSPFNYKKCIECFLLPICMGGCLYSGKLLKNGPNCETWKYNLDEVLKLTYLQKGNIHKNMLTYSEFL